MSTDEFDELYAIDGGGLDSDDRYPHMTEYQAQRLQDFITEAEFAYEEHPMEAWGDAHDAGERVEKAEKQIFDFVNLLLAERDAKISALNTPAPKMRYPQVEQAAKMLEQITDIGRLPKEVYHLLSALRDSGLID